MKKAVGRLRIGIFLCSLALLLQVNSLNANALFKGNKNTEYFTGTIGKTKKYPIQMAFCDEDENDDEGNLQGSYYYESGGEHLPLDGYFSEDDDDQLTLTVRISGKKVERFKGRFKNPKKLAGHWYQKSKKFSFELTKIAQQTTISYEQNLVSLSLSFPSILKKNNINRHYQSHIIQKEIDSHNNDIRCFNNANPHPSSLFGIMRTCNISLQYYSNDLVSMYRIYSTGDGNLFRTDVNTINLWSNKGVVKHLTMSDLFKPDSNYANELYRICEELELHPAFVTKPDQQWIDFFDTHFVITPNGIYLEDGHQAPSNIVIPYNKIADLIHPQGPLAKFMP